VAVEYKSNCCDGEVWTGVPKSAQATATSLASQCSSSWPLCGCADQTIRTDDNSVVATNFGQVIVSAVALTCQAGKCKSYAAICGQPCASGTLCLSCATPATDATTAICAKVCPDGGI
jgi:hypothetical protein